MKKSGVLMPVFSLPSPYGIGTLGKGAYKFVLYRSGYALRRRGPSRKGSAPKASRRKGDRLRCAVCFKAADAAGGI